MKDLAHLAPCGILEFQEDGQIIRANQRMLEILGWSGEELGAVNFDSILTMSSRIFHQTHFLPLLRLHGRAEEVYLTLRGKTVTSIPVLTNAVRIQTDSAFHVICVFMPVYQRRKYEDEILAGKKRAEEALRNNEELKRLQGELEQRLQELDRHVLELDRKNRELLRLNEILSHDLREPVRKISAFTDLLLEENGEVLNENGRKAVSRIEAASTRLQELLRILQQFLSLDDRGQLTAGVDLGKLVRLAHERVTRSECLPLQLEMDDPLPQVDGYAAQLLVLFEILLRNTFRMRGEETPTIQIRSLRIQQNSFQKIAGKYRYIDFGQITLSDNSRGYACSDCDSLFELLSKKGQGELLDAGLAICRRIVENHHGSISLHSPAGQGCTFTILLPIQQYLLPENTPSPTQPE